MKKMILKNISFRKCIGVVLSFAMIVSFLPISAYGYVTPTDSTPPTLMSASRTSNTEITVTLSENCVNLTKSGDGGFTVTQTSGASTYLVSATAQVIDLKHVALTVEDMPASCDQGVTVTCTKGINGTIADTAGNALETTSTGVAVPAWDGTPPTLVSASLISSTEITVTLSEDCQNLTQANDGGFTVKETGGTTAYAVSATAQCEDTGHVVLTVADLSASRSKGVTITYTKGTNGTIADLAGNALASNSIGVSIAPWDSDVPTVEITTTADNPTYTRSIPLTITFSEAVTGFTADDITVEYATKNDNFSGSGSVYRITLTPTGDGDTIIVDIAAGAAKDSAGNDNAAATQFSIVYASTIDYAVDGGSITFAPSTKTVVGFKGSPTTVVIPDKIGDVSVTSLGQNSLSNCTSMTSITLPDSITSMQQGVFSGCTGLTSITIPDSVTVINQSTFVNCANLREVIFPSDLTAVRDQSFNGCSSLETITFPDTLELIGWGAFLNCTGLKSITIPASVISIEGSAFQNCGSLAAVYMKGNAPTYGDNVFQSTAAGITVFYRAGATGFSGTYAGCATALWVQHTVTVSCGDHGTVFPETTAVYDGETVTFTITPDTGFQISTLTFNGENVTADAGGEYLSPAVCDDAELNVTFEAVGTPTVTISTEAHDPTNASPITVTITFSEAVTGFDISDIGVTGGTAGNFNTTSAAVYTADITPSGDGTVTISVAAGAAQSGGIGNRAAVPLSVTYDSTAPTLSNADADQITGSEASLSFTSNEAGTYYYLVYPAAYTAPGADTVRAQGDGAAAKGAGAAVSGSNSAKVTGLSATTDYKAYVVVEDAAGNLSTVKAIAFTTTIIKIPLTSSVTSFTNGATYTIKDAEQFERLASLGQGGKSGAGATFELINDIAFGYWQDTDGDGTADDGEIFDAPSGGSAYTKTNYVPIGVGGHQFSGVFDGKGHTVSGIYCKETNLNMGLFSSISGGTVKNIRVTNSFFDTSGSTISSSAGVVSNLEDGGAVENCTVDSSVTIKGKRNSGGIAGSCRASTIRGCYNGAAVSVSEGIVGGIAGYVDGGSLIACCWNSGSVSGISNAGGIAGESITDGDTLQNCCNTGTVAVSSGNGGGIAGMGVKVEYCYSAAAVVSSASGIGAILGNFVNKNSSATGCFYDNQVCALKGVNKKDAAGIEGKTTAEMQSATAFTGWDTGIWHFSSGSYPRLTALMSTDTAAPTLVSAKILSITSIKVTLSEDCRLLTKASSGGFSVKETGGTAVYAVTATAQGDNPREVVLTVQDMYASCGKGVTVTYTHGTSGTIEDLAGNVMGSDASGVAATAGETTPPTMVSAMYVNNTQITVTLSEDCLGLTNPNDGGFTVKETGVTTTYMVTSTVRESSKKIILYVENMSASCAKGVTVTYKKGGSGIVTDLMGNAMETNGTGVLVAAWDTGRPEVSGVSSGASYNADVAPTFTEGTATLQKDGGAASAYTSGTAISAEGGYVLTVTNAAGSTVVSFTIDKTAPVLSGLSRVSVTSAGAALQFISSEITPYYFLILPAEDSEPDADAVRDAGPGAGWSGTASAGTNSVNVSGLIAGTDYKAYLILEDEAGNRSGMESAGLTTGDTVIPLDSAVTTLQSGVTYTVDSTDQLNRLGYLVQTGQSGAGSTFVLTEDIVFGYWQDKNTNGVVDNGEIYNAPSGGTAYTDLNYTVIGRYLKYFSGTFDGRGHTVSGLYTSEDNSSGNLALSALIGGVDGGIVRNVGVKESYIQGYKYPAGVVGYLVSGTVENCYADESVSIAGPGISIGGVVGSCESSVISCCYNRGSVNGKGFVTHLGGIVGQIIGENSAICRCYNSGTVYAENNRHGTGGIAGLLSTGSGNRIENCYNTGSVTGSGAMFGGIAGCSFGSILNCYNAAAVDDTSWNGNIVGSRAYLDSYVTTGCYYDSEVCAVGGIEGHDTAGSTEGKVTVDMQSSTPFFGWDTGLWSFESGKYPQLVGFTDFEHTVPTITGASRSDDTEITITLSEDCRYLRKTSDGGFTVTEKDGTKTYAVTSTAKGTDAQHIVLTLANMAASGAKGITVTYTKGKTGTIADLAYNPLKTDGTGVTIGAWDTAGPEVIGVNDKASYKTSVTPTFTEGTATLKKGSGIAGNYASGTVITADGAYVLTVTDTSGNVTVISFTIDTTAPEVSGVSDGASYNTDVTPSFTEGTATLQKDGGTANAYVSGTAITADGAYVLTVTDAVGNEMVINFTIDRIAPVLSDAGVDTITGAGATLNFTSGEACSYYYLVLPADNTAPDAETVRAQGYGPEAFGTGAAALGSNSVDMTGLIAGTDYRVYVITEDAAGNLSEVKAASFTTADNEIALNASVTTLEAGKTYTIGSAEQLNYLAGLVDGGQTGAGSTFVLTSDIRFGYWQDKDADGVADYGEIYNAESGGDAYTATNYDMIGYIDDPTYTFYSFGGTFDGRGHTVSGLYNNTSDPTIWYSALFACVDGGTVRNVGVKESYIQGGISVAAVVGDCYRGTVENCWTEESVSIIGFGYCIGGIVGYCDSSTVQYCYNKGSVSGTGESYGIGGVTGYVGYDYVNGEKSVVQCCCNTGSVSGENGYNSILDIGGVVGLLYDEGSGNLLQNCYNTGSVSGSGWYIGGVVGENQGITQYCYNAGTVSGSDYAGGVAGDNYGTMTGCYYDSLVCILGGINGSDVDCSAQGKDTAWMKSGSTYADWNIGFWHFESGKYPELFGFLVFDSIPPTVTLSSLASETTNSSPFTITITFSEAVTGFEAGDLTVGNGTKGTLSGNGKDYTIDITPVTDGAVTVDIAAGVAADAAGNGSEAATQLSRTYDGTAPTAPTVTSTSDLTTDTTPTWTWTAGTGGSGTFWYKLDSSNLTSGTISTTTPSYTPQTDLADGDHTLYVQERDAVGNWSASGSYKVTVDTTAPTAPSVTSTSDLTTDTAPEWTWTAGENIGNGTFRYKLDDSNLASDATETTDKSYTPTSTLSDGEHTLYVQERDAAGNWSASGSFAVTVDTTAPTAPTVTSTSPSTTDTTPEWTWTAGTGGNGTFRYKLDDSDLTSGTTSTADLTYTASALSDGDHTLYVQERDAVGNWSGSGSFAVTVDTIAPTAPSVTSTSALMNDATPEWTWTAGTGGRGTFRYKLDSSDLTSSATETTTASYTPTSALSDGEHTLYVQERDDAGNWSVSGSFAVAVDTTPPVAGGAGAISPTNISWDSLKLSWTAASDTDTLQEYLQYKIVRSENNNITTVADVNTNGTLVMDWTADLTGMAVTGLTGPKNYYLNVIVKDAAGNETVYSSVSITTAAPPEDDTPVPEVTVYVDGEKQNAGTLTTTTAGDRTVSTVTVNDEKLEQFLDEKGNNAVVTIPISTGSAVAEGVLNGQTVKNMEDKEAILVVKTNSSSYTLPASEVDIEAVSKQIGENVTLSNIKVTVSISEPSDAMTTIIENASKDGGFTIAVPTVEFTISCEYGGRTVEVNSFNAYVERTIAIPDGVDPSKITTGIVVDPDGTVHHVPTRITVIDGKYYAVINSLTNSAYSVIWNPVRFTDVENHWAKNSVNDMGSRMVVSGVGGNNYEPDRDITRAEFATIIVRALGLDPGKGVSCFDDVNENDWFCGYIKTASEYGLINGYGAGIFGPNDKITREQAMAIIARAMKITGLKTSMSAVDVENLLSEYADGGLISAYAKDGIAACVNSGIVKGRENSMMAPKENITRAEVAVIAERLLQKSELI